MPTSTFVRLGGGWRLVGSAAPTSPPGTVAAAITGPTSPREGTYRYQVDLALGAVVQVTWRLDGVVVAAAPTDQSVLITLTPGSRVITAEGRADTNATFTASLTVAVSAAPPIGTGDPVGSTPPVPGQRGPSGGNPLWSPLNPPRDAPITATVSNTSELVAALRAVGPNQAAVIAMTAGDYGLVTLAASNGQAIPAHLTRDLTTARRILIRPVGWGTPGHAKVTMDLEVHTPNVAVVGVNLTGLTLRKAASGHSSQANRNCDNFWLSEFVYIGSAQFTLRGSNYTIVEGVKPGVPLKDGDVMQVGAHDASSVPRQVLIRAVWLDGMVLRTPGQHSDGVQVTQVTGDGVTFENIYFGELKRGGDLPNATTQLKAETSNYGLTAGRVIFRESQLSGVQPGTNASGGGVVFANGNRAGQNMDSTWEDCHFWQSPTTETPPRTGASFKATSTDRVPVMRRCRGNAALTWGPSTTNPVTTGDFADFDPTVVQYPTLNKPLWFDQVFDAVRHAGDITNWPAPTRAALGY